MVIEMNVFAHLCEPKRFSVNGVSAMVRDFGTMRDVSPKKAPTGGCGDMRFERSAPTDGVLIKYGITADEWVKVAEMLEDELSFGLCDLCS